MFPPSRFARDLYFVTVVIVTSFKLYPHLNFEKCPAPDNDANQSWLSCGRGPNSQSIDTPRMYYQSSRDILSNGIDLKEQASTVLSWWFGGLIKDLEAL